MSLLLTVIVAEALASRLSKPDGGFTINPRDLGEPKTGFALSIFPDRSKSLDPSSVSAPRILNFAEQNGDLLEQEGNMLGAWHDPETNRVFFDVAKVVESENEAKKLALENDQVAYFDIAAGKSVDVNRQATSGGATGFAAAAMSDIEAIKPDTTAAQGHALTLTDADVEEAYKADSTSTMVLSVTPAAEVTKAPAETAKPVGGADFE